MPLGDYAIGLAFFIATVGAVGIAAYLLLRRTLRFLTGAPAVVGFTVVLTAGLIAVHLVPGVLGLLSRWSVLACALLLAAVAWWRLPTRPFAEEAETARRPPPSPRTSRALAGGAGAALVVFVLAQAWVATVVPSTGIDTVTFHLPNVAAWIQSGTVWRVDNFTPLLAPGNYPQSGDVLVLVAVLPWENDAFARLVNLPFVAVTGAGVYAVAVELRAARATATIFATTFAALPVLSLAAYRGAQTDPVLVAMLIAGALFLLRHSRTGRASDLGLAGLALGVAFGTKWYGVSSVAVVLLVWAVASLISRRRPAPVLRDGAVLVGLIALAGGFWLVRNWVVSGNPVMPVKVELLGATLFDAPRDFIRECAGYTIAHYVGDPGAWSEYILPAYGVNYALPGTVIAVGLLAAAVLLLGRLRGWSGRRDEAGRALAVAACACLLTVAYALTPYSAFGPEGQPLLTGANARYLLPALVVAAPAAAWCAMHVGRLRVPLEALGAVAVADGIRLGFDVPVRLVFLTALTVAVVIALAIAVVALSRRLGVGPRLAVRAAMALLAAVAIVAVGHLRQVEFNDGRYAGLEPALDWILAHAPEGKRIALAGTWDVGGLAPVLPAFGPRLGNEVAYLGTYARGQLREFDTREKWAAAARRRDFDLLIVGSGAYSEACPVPGSETDDDAWARAEGFTRLAGSRRLRLYRVTPVPGAGDAARGEDGGGAPRPTLPWLSSTARVLAVSARRDQEHAVAEVRRPGTSCEPETLRGPDRRVREGLRVSTGLGEVVAHRERLRIGAGGHDLEAMAVEEQRHAVAREVLHMRGDHGPPSRSQKAGHRAARVGEHQHERSRWGEQRPRPLKGGARIRQVLYDVAHYHRPEVTLGQRRLEHALGAHVESEPIARVGGREPAGLDSHGVPAAGVGLGHQEADPASEVDERSRLDVPLDALQHPASGGPLPRRLLDVVGRSRLRVVARQPPLVGHPLELHVPARDTPHDVV